MIKKLIPNTLRFQLPLTYAGMALLATSLIGAVLFLIISNYYRSLEQRYLDGNAQGLAQSLRVFVNRENIVGSEDLKTNTNLFKDQVSVAAFLMQSRVRILDPFGTIIADSGTPTKDWYIHLPGREDTQLPDGEPAQENSAPVQPFSFSPGKRPESDGENPRPGFRASPNMFGFMLESDSLESGVRSRQMSQAAFHNQAGEVLGTVEISESPEYGRNIINKVVQGWMVASLVAMVVSMMIGWLVSRQINRPISALEDATIRMKEGDLTARAPLLKPAELTSLADTFNQMAERIQKNVGTLRRFVSDAAHEIRTPLTALQADLSMALGEKDPQNKTNLVSRSLDQVKRLELLSKDLLDLSKIESESPQASTEKFDLVQVVLQASEIPASAAEQAGIDFQLILPEKPVTIQGRPLQIHRAIQNLIENGIKFNHTGGYALVNLKVDGDWAMITVEDNGIGISTQERELVFDHFYRSRNVSSYPGSGLGLAIAKAIILNHQGEIGLLPGEIPTRFFIRLKLAD